MKVAGIFILDFISESLSFRDCKEQKLQLNIHKNFIMPIDKTFFFILLYFFSPQTVLSVMAFNVILPFLILLLASFLESFIKICRIDSIILFVFTLFQQEHYSPCQSVFFCFLFFLYLFLIFPFFAT